MNPEYSREDHTNQQPTSYTNESHHNPVTPKKNPVLLYSLEKPIRRKNQQQIIVLDDDEKEKDDRYSSEEGHDSSFLPSNPDVSLVISTRNHVDDLKDPVKMNHDVAPLFMDDKKTSMDKPMQQSSLSEETSNTVPKKEKVKDPVKMKVMDYKKTSMDKSMQQSCLSEETSNTVQKKKMRRVNKVTLEPLTENPYIPQFPPSSSCKWSYDPVSYVVLAKFEAKDGQVKIEKVDLECILDMMERPDITLVMEGLFDNMDTRLWSLQRMECRMGSTRHYKFVQFHRSLLSKDITVKDRSEAYFVETEIPGYCSMKLCDFFDYLRKREKIMSKYTIDNLKKDIAECNHARSTDRHVVIERNGTKETVDVMRTSLYLTDYELDENMPLHYQDLLTNFALPQILPGGSFCMMNAIPSTMRPFMGPNLYITPPGSFTHFHQDGFGTVDSGHICLEGYNEVVMLRRLPLEHKENAMNILTRGSRQNLDYDSLRKHPHGHDNADKPPWPDVDSVEECRRWGYCPSVFILKPGQYVHINKGRIHAFRKMPSFKLIDTDCHAKLRNEIVAGYTTLDEALCVSIAWDWQFVGHTPLGIDEEMSVSLEASRINSTTGLQSLAVAEVCLIYLCIEYLSRYEADISDHLTRAKALTVLKGVLPSLQKMVNGRRYDMAKLETGGFKFNKSERPIADEYRPSAPTNPFGNDYYCKICHRELSNIYMHCDGCEDILNQDYNVCVNCYTERKHMDFYGINPSRSERWSIFHHVVHHGSSCKCSINRSKQKTPTCFICRWCCACSCACHESFTLQYRFRTIEGEEELLRRIQRCVQGSERQNTLL